MTQFLDNTGAPLAAGKVYTYAADGLTPKATYQDAALTILNENPVPLDTAGRAIIIGSGTFVFALFDADGVQIYKQATADTTLSLNASSFGLQILTAANAAAVLSLLGITQFTLPAGLIVPYGRFNSPPSGWLYCDGSAVSRTTYSTLFGIIGTTFGTGDGVTTFNIPDLRGRTVFGPNDGSGRLNVVNNAQGQADGDQYAQADTITVNVTDPGHGHQEAIGQGSGGAFLAWNVSAQGNVIGTLNYSTTTAVTGVTADASSSLIGTKQNIPPMLCANFIISTGT